MKKRKNFINLKFFLLCAIFLLSILGAFRTVRADENDVSHQAHLNEARGPRLGSNCTGCHLSGIPSQEDVDYNFCKTCHGADGEYDGAKSKNSSVGAEDNWVINGTQSAIYETDGSLKSEKKKWCVGCHDDGVCAIQSARASNIAGKSMSGDWQGPGSLTIVSSNISGVDNLLDGDLSTGNTGKSGNEIIFDLGRTLSVFHLRLYTINSDTRWKIDGGNDLINWTRIVLGQSVLFAAPTWQAGPQDGWNEVRLDVCIPVRYIRLKKISPWPFAENCFREFEVKEDLQYGYYLNGHKISCTICHDIQKIHIDGNQRTYNHVSDPYNDLDLNNFHNGYRLKKVEIGDIFYPPLELPRGGCNWRDYPRTDNDFALCFTCHDKYKLLGDSSGIDGFFMDPLQTNFWKEDCSLDGCKPKNQHLIHLRGRGPSGNNKDWDSDWDGTADSPQSCPACHNVHGSPTPAMTRHGELVSSPGTADKAPMFNFYYISEDGKIDQEITKVTESFGGKTQFYGGGPGTVGKNNVCNMCHNGLVTYRRPPVPSPVAECKDCHDKSSHSTHIEADSKGPNIDCGCCHANVDPHEQALLFADGQATLAETQVCNTCHSPNGTYDGISDPTIGAKSNWIDGVYQDNILKPDKEKWCATCHDEEPANSKADGSGVNAPAVIGNESFVNPYGYYKTGHGKDNNVRCIDCHDAAMIHIDHEHRTYKASSGNYQEGYRLKMVNDQAPITIRNHPPKISDPTKSWTDFVLCFSCHDKYEILGHSEGEGAWHQGPPFKTKFASYRNQHQWHLALDVRNYCDSDFDGAGDAAATCTTCHNVHGSPSPVMIRHGELISPPGTQDCVPSFDFAWLTIDEGGSCIWRPNIKIAGRYKVHIKWGKGLVGNGEVNSVQAKFKIVHAKGETEIICNQRENIGKWNRAGVFKFNKGTSGYVELTSEGIKDLVSTSDTARDAVSYVVADAVRFKHKKGLDKIVINDSKAEYIGEWQKNYDPECKRGDYHYYRKSKRNEVATRDESIGGNMAHPDNIIYNYSCVGCHSELFYAHPSISPE